MVIYFFKIDMHLYLLFILELYSVSNGIHYARRQPINITIIVWANRVSVYNISSAKFQRNFAVLC